MQATILRALALSLVFSGLGLAWVIYQVGSPQDLLVVRKLPLPYLGAALGALFLSYLFAAWRLQYLCKRLEFRLYLRHALRTHILGVFSTTVTPGGSGSLPAVALILNHQGLASGSAWAVGVSIFAADALFHAWGMPLALTSLYLLGLYPTSPIWIILGIVATLLTAALAYLVLFKLVWLEPLTRSFLRGPLLRFRRSGLRFIQSLLESNALFLNASVSWHVSVQAFTVLSWGSLFLILFFLARGFGIQLSVLATEAAQMVVTILSTVVPTPGGSGFFELGISYLLIGEGNDSAVPAVILLWRLLTYYLYFVLGPLLGGYLLLKRLQQREELQQPG